MVIENNFGKLDQNLLYRIFFKSGNIPELPKVCQLFNETLKIGSKQLYEALIEEFGENCLYDALKGMKLEKKSYSAKIDGLFFKVYQNSDPLKKCGINYDMNALREYMRPLLLAEGYRKLWLALLKVADPQLQFLMLKESFGQQPLENAERIRQFFKLNVSEIEKVTSLDLSQQELRVLPPEIACFSQLNKLDLSHNYLSELPEEIGQLRELEELKVNDNVLLSLPVTIGQLKSLSDFQCAENQLTQVPNEICQLLELKSLHLSSNPIHILPDKMGKLQSLNYLYLDGCRLTSLPSSLGKIPFLIGLYLYGNCLSELPSSLCKMQDLKFLSLQNNHLMALPEDIGTISSLRSLFVDGNNLKELPQSICSLTQLKRLSVSNNHLSLLPQGMQKLKQLIYFDCAGNFLDDLRLNNKETVLNSSMTKDRFQKTYWGLGENKWKEGIDGADHRFGPNVYDLGLHETAVAEPGFLNGIEKAFQFLNENFNRKIDAKFYLDLHKVACGHFAGDANNTLMGQEKVGVFRDKDDILGAPFSEDNLMTPRAIDEFYKLNDELTLRFGASFRVGDLILPSNTPQSMLMCYQKLSKKQVEIIFNYFLTNFYDDIGRADAPDSKIKAIAKFIQRLEWLHPFRDGCGRTNSALLNYLLTVYGFNPVLLEDPYISSYNGLNEFTSQLITGIFDWQKESRSIQSRKMDKT
jgi:Leucine-rich repeat (LRR) protein